MLKLCKKLNQQCWSRLFLLPFTRRLIFLCYAHISPSKMLPAARQASAWQIDSPLRCMKLYWGLVYLCGRRKSMEKRLSVFVCAAVWAIEWQRESTELAGKWPTDNKPPVNNTYTNIVTLLDTCWRVERLPRALLFFSFSCLFIHSFVRTKAASSLLSDFVFVNKTNTYEFSCFLNRMRITSVFGDVFSFFSFQFRNFHRENILFQFFLRTQTHSLVSFRFNIRLQARITVEEEKLKKNDTTQFLLRSSDVFDDHERKKNYKKLKIK